jgi:fused signal recognition particle receptor
MFRKITLVGVLLALIVIVMGAYVRLSDAGLGCPDWPGCYGRIIPEDSAEFRSGAELAFPDRPLDSAKAWKEMSHRYLAAGLGVVILLLAVSSWWQRQCRAAAMTASWGLAAMAAVQAALGMWAVKLHTMPVVVTAHLLLGMLTFWLLFWLYLRVGPGVSRMTARGGPANFARLGILVLFFQIVLGGWTSTNYASLACPDFPLCQGEWWPKADYREALNFFHGIVTGETGILPAEAQVAVHWLHRVGAVLTLLLLSGVALSAALTKRARSVRRAALWLSLLLIVQFGLGIAVIMLALPLWIAVTHTAFAALLMLPLIVISFYSRYGYEVPQKEAPAIEAVRVPAERAVEKEYVPAAPETLYLRLKSQLKRTRTGLTGALQLPFGQKEINDDLLEQIETSLLTADIGVEATNNIIDRLTQSVERHQLNDASALSSALKQELLNILAPCSQPLQIRKQDGPFVILVVGVNGAGKTTTIGKLAKRLQAQGLSVMLAAGDTFRAAAVEQLQTWGERNNIHVVAQHTGADSASVIYDGLQSAKAKNIDVLIADTAGRLHTKSNLMDELKKVKRIMGKLDEAAPHEVLLVLDAGTGQNALSQARLFNEAVELTGIVLTKLDGTAKGGVIFALAKQLGIPIRYIGVGEGIDDLQDFHAETFVNALFARD